MPHWKPMMKQSDQITIVDPTIKTPACLSASLKKRKTRPRSNSPNTRPPNFTMSPNDATQSRGTVSQPIILPMQAYRKQYECIAGGRGGLPGGPWSRRAAAAQATMRAVAAPDDLTAYARIRNAALELFSKQGSAR